MIADNEELDALVAELADLHIQATKERSHYYVGHRTQKAVAAITALRARVAEQEASFDLRWSADMRAIERWHKAGGDALTWPDHADLCVWLLERLTATENERDAMAAAMPAGQADVALAHAVEKSRAELAESQLQQVKADAERLDHLDAVNAKLNAHYGTVYGWRIDVNHNRIAVTLSDMNIPALSVRQAIDSYRWRNDGTA